jgi:hypothetical protein
MFNLRNGVINIIKDRVTYDLCVQRGLFAHLKGNIERVDAEGKTYVETWRTRADVKALAIELETEINAETARRAKQHAINTGVYQDAAALSLSDAPAENKNGSLSDAEK